MSDYRRSRAITEGVERTPNRAMLRAVGFRDEDFAKPIIGVANAYSTITPCNLSLNDLTSSAVAALRQDESCERGRDPALENQSDPLLDARTIPKSRKVNFCLAWDFVIGINPALIPSDSIYLWAPNPR